MPKSPILLAGIIAGLTLEAFSKKLPGSMDGAVHFRESKVTGEKSLSMNEASAGHLRMRLLKHPQLDSGQFLLSVYARGECSIYYPATIYFRIDDVLDSLRSNDDNSDCRFNKEKRAAETVRVFYIYRPLLKALVDSKSAMVSWAQNESTMKNGKGTALAGFKTFLAEADRNGLE